MASSTEALASPTRAVAPRRAGRYLHLWFVLVVGLAGAVLAVIVPPGKPPDEYAHLQRIWSISQGRVVPEVRSDGTGGGPVEACITAFGDTGFRNYLSTKPVSFSKMWHSPLPCRGEGRATTFQDFGNTAVNSPVTYAPQVVAMTTLDALGASVTAMIIGARLAALAAYLALVAIAIVVAPRAKAWFVLIGGLPAAVGLASTLSSDSMVLGPALLSVALILRLRAGAPTDDARRCRHLRLALACTLLVLCVAKNSYGPFVLLWFLVPLPEGDGIGAVNGWRRLLVRLSVPAAGAVLAGLWASLVGNVTRFPPSRVFPGVDPHGQLSWVLRHPIDAASVLWHTVASREFFGAIVPRVVGRYPSGRVGLDGAIHSPAVPPWILAVIVVCAGFVLWSERGARRDGASGLVAGVVAAVAVGSALLVMVLVYSVSSPVGWPNVLLLQGRYFTPLLGLAVLPLAERRSPRTQPGAVITRVHAGALACTGVALAGCIAAAWTMYFR